MPNEAGRDDALLNQTIGSLNTKADQSQKETAMIRVDMRSMEAKLDNIPGVVEEIVTRLMKPIDTRLQKVEVTVNEVQMTVIRWKAVLAFIGVGASFFGILVGYFANLKKMFGF